MPIIDLNINQMMCYRCNKVWLPRLAEDAPNFFMGEDSGIESPSRSLGMAFADLQHVPMRIAAEQCTRVAKPPESLQAVCFCCLPGKLTLYQEAEFRTH